MVISSTRFIGGVIALVTVAASVTIGAGAAVGDDVLLPGPPLYLNPASTTLEAARSLTGQARADAQLLGSFPSASWFTKGSPAEAQAAVAEVMTDAAASASVPVLVAYNLPFRDCAQYSAGGAADTAAYTAWIDGFAAGIGDGDAIVILEPDGLGIIPWNTDLNGAAEWCQPAELDATTAASDRYEQVNYAVDALTALPNTSVYLDGTHSGWLGVGDISDRLIKAGVDRADGFFVNASNYVLSERLQKYGSWISDCIYLSQNSWYEPSFCGSQYYPANPGDFSTWGLTDAAYDQAFADTGLTRTPEEQAHFVIDSSRNGQGPWTPPAGTYTDAEDWCNPPDRGLGQAPTTETGDPLLDAYLWIKVPGESDGLCFRGTGGPTDPERGMVDPAAGVWFPEQARELIALSSPAVSAQTCDVTYTASRSIRANFVGAISVKNTGAEPIDGWKLGWSFGGDQAIRKMLGATAGQSGAAITATNFRSNKAIAPGKSVKIGFLATTHAGPNQQPWLFTLNGRPCTSN